MLVGTTKFTMLNSQHDVTLNVRLNGFQLQMTKICKVLGVIIGNNLSWKEQYNAFIADVCYE